MGCKKICAQIYVKDGCAFNSYEATEKITESGDISELAEMFENRGADCIFIYDLSEDDVSHERTILAIRSITSKIDIPVIAGGNVKRLEDIKKYLYAGCAMAIVDGVSEGSAIALGDIALMSRDTKTKRFVLEYLIPKGSDRILIYGIKDGQVDIKNFWSYNNHKSLWMYTVEH